MDISVPFRWPVLSQSTVDRVIEQLSVSISIYDRSGVFERFEDRMASYHGRRYAVLFNSGTSALFASYVALGLKPGDRVLCPAYTFLATATPLLSLGIAPVLIDCDDSGNLCPVALAAEMSSEVKAIVVTHMWGLPASIEKIRAVADQYNVPVVEDISHSFGARTSGRLMGTFGKVAAVSLQAQKTLTGGEGGVLLTDDEEVYYRSLAVGHYNKRCKNEIPSSHDLHQIAVTGFGMKFRAHPLAVAIADEQMDSIENVLQQRRSVAAAMMSELSRDEKLKVPYINDDIEPSWYAFVMVSEPRVVDYIVKRAKEIEMVNLDRPLSTCPLNHHSIFRDPGQFKGYYPLLPSSAPVQPPSPNAERVWRGSLKLPVWHEKRDLELARYHVNTLVELSREFES